MGFVLRGWPGCWYLNCIEGLGFGSTFGDGFVNLVSVEPLFSFPDDAYCFGVFDFVVGGV